MNPVTIYDIASRAGVSPMSVSLALHPPSGRRRISEKTRNRIMRIARRMNYSANTLARGLSSGRTYIVGSCETSNINLREPFWHSFVSAFQRRLLDFGYRLAFFYFEKGQDADFGEFIRPHRFVDAVIIRSGSLHQKEIAAIRASGIKAVSLYAKERGFRSLLIDEYGSGEMAANYIFSRGHRRAAIIGHMSVSKHRCGRIHGFFDRARAIGLDVPPALRFMSRGLGIHGIESRVACGMFGKFLSARSNVRCLYVPSDQYAIPILGEMDRLGIRLGKDISMLSYDNLEPLVPIPWQKPRLTTLAPPHAEMGKRAAEIIADSADSGTGITSFPVSLVERGSVADRKKAQGR